MVGEEKQGSGHPASRREVRWVIIAFVALALASFGLLRSLEKPWNGSTGKIVYSGQAHALSAGQRYAGALVAYFRPPQKLTDEMRADHWIILGLWVGTGGMILFALAAAATARWWVPGCMHSGEDDEGEADPVPKLREIPLWSWAVLLAALALGVGVRTPALSGAIQWDEQDNLRRNIHGYWKFNSPTETPKWHEASLQSALWEDQRGNNPPLFSALSHISVDLYRAASGKPREHYNLVAVRLPAFIFGVLAIASLWWGLHAVGLPRAAPWAAVFAAVHPLASAFSCQARGYAMTLFLTPLVLAMAWRYLRTGTWRDLLALAAAGVALLWSFPGGLYFLAVVHLLLFALLVRQWRRDGARGCVRFMRWGCVNVLSAAVFFWLMAPVFPQMATFMNHGFQKGVMPPFWYVVSYNLFATGLRFQFPMDPFFRTGRSVASPSVLGWLFGDYWRAWPLATWAMFVFPALVSGGVFLWWRRPAVRSWAQLATAAMVGGVLCVAHHAFITGCYIYVWYVIYALPVFLAAMGTSVDALGRRYLPSSPRLLAGGLTSLFALWMLAVTHPLINPHGWKTTQCHMPPQPVCMRWQAPEGEIPNTRFLRGHTLWVNYEDGFQAAFRDYPGQETAWAPIIHRPESVRGEGFARWKPVMAGALGKKDGPQAVAGAEGTR